MKKITVLVAISLTSPAEAFDSGMQYQEYLTLGKTARYQIAGELLAWQELGHKDCKDSLGQTVINLEEVSSLAKVAQSDPSKLAILNGAYQRAITDPNYVFRDRFKCQMLQASAANFGLVELVQPTEAELNELRLIGSLGSGLIAKTSRLRREHRLT